MREKYCCLVGGWKLVLKHGVRGKPEAEQSDNPFTYQSRPPVPSSLFVTPTQLPSLARLPLPEVIPHPLILRIYFFDNSRLCLKLIPCQIAANVLQFVRLFDPVVLEIALLYFTGDVDLRKLLSRICECACSIVDHLFCMMLGMCHRRECGLSLFLQKPS